MTQSSGEAAVASTATLSMHYVALAWTRSASPSVTGYNVYRSAYATGPFQRINLFLEPATVFTDYTVAAGHTYHYVVTAMVGTSESQHSGQVTAVVPSP